MAELISYKIATININAVRCDTKINALASFIRSAELDVIFLQEVARTNIDLPGFRIEYNVDERRRGTAIAIRSYFNCNRIDRSFDSRLIIWARASMVSRSLTCMLHLVHKIEQREKIFTRKLFLTTTITPAIPL